MLINLEAKDIAKNKALLKVECLVKKLAFTTLKDHKEIFFASLSYHLINLSKRELGKIIQVRLEKINKALIKHLDVDQWKNSSAVKEWFKGIDNKQDSIFIKFDIREFYPYILESTFKMSILFTKEYHNIPDKMLEY